jgi:hypothetical protein
MATFGRDGAWQAWPQTPVWHHAVVGGEGQRELLFQIVEVFREGLHLASQPVCVLTQRQRLALHAIGLEGIPHGRSPERRFDWFGSAVDHAGHDLDHPTPVPFFDHHGIAQGWWRAAAWFGKPSTRTLAGGRDPSARQV